jgi:hypothetical protein
MENLKEHLNRLGFYVLSGDESTLDVFVTSSEKPCDIVFFEKILDKLEKSWYNITGQKNGGHSQ